MFPFLKRAVFGCCADPDYLVVGGLGTPDGRNDYVGERTQMSIWAIMKVSQIDLKHVLRCNLFPDRQLFRSPMS
jgi:hypothetical protein